MLVFLKISPRQHCLCCVVVSPALGVFHNPLRLHRANVLDTEGLLCHLNLNGWETKLQADEGNQNRNKLWLQEKGDSLVLLLFKPYVSLCDDKIMNNIMYLIVNPKVSALALIRFHMLGCKRIHQHVQSVPVRFYKNFGRLLNDHGILSTQPTVFCFQSMKWILFFKH